MPPPQLVCAAHPPLVKLSAAPCSKKDPETIYSLNLPESMRSKTNSPFLLQDFPLPFSCPPRPLSAPFPSLLSHLGGGDMPDNIYNTYTLYAVEICQTPPVQCTQGTCIPLCVRGRYVSKEEQPRAQIRLVFAFVFAKVDMLWSSCAQFRSCFVFVMKIVLCL